jgi:hypothetical protein
MTKKAGTRNARPEKPEGVRNYENSVGESRKRGTYEGRKWGIQEVRE